MEAMILFAFATLLLTIFLVVVLLDTYLIKRYRRFFFGSVNTHLAKYSLHYAFLLSLAGIAGSLYISNVIGYEPCILCWFQRICLYPQAVLFFIAILKKDRSIFSYAVPLSILGALIATYHYVLQLGATALPCPATGGVSCTLYSTLYFGYINIPMMALASFLSLIVLAYIQKK